MNCSFFNKHYPYMSTLLTTDGYVNGIKIDRIQWDTGASRTLMSSRLIKQLSLNSIGDVVVTGISEQHIVRKYQVCFCTENLHFDNWTVLESDIKGFDILIGMDIIGLGDFYYTTSKKQSSFGFRLPACGNFDFIDKQQYFEYSARFIATQQQENSSPAFCIGEAGCEINGKIC